MPSHEQKTTPQRIAAKVKAAKALELRKEGQTFQAIAETAGYNSPQAAHEAVKRAIKEIIREPAEDVIRLELERIDALWGIQYLNAQTGDVQAMAACMRLMERRAKLLGLDAPEKVDAKIVMPDQDEVDSRLARAIAAHGEAGGAGEPDA